MWFSIQSLRYKPKDCQHNCIKTKYNLQQNSTISCWVFLFDQNLKIFMNNNKEGWQTEEDKKIYKLDWMQLEGNPNK
jgi:hypothetical protein